VVVAPATSSDPRSDPSLLHLPLCVGLRPVGKLPGCGHVRSSVGKRRLSERKRRVLAIGFLVIGVGLIPWSLFLAWLLPARHVQDDFYDVAWAGFDVLLAAMLAVTGLGLLRRRIWVQATAASAATMLIVDAWFDVLSADHSAERFAALLLAIFAELPTAAICIVIALDSEAAAERAYRYLGLVRRSEVVAAPADQERLGSR
jgi:hypothetical protein